MERGDSRRRKNAEVTTDHNVHQNVNNNFNKSGDPGTKVLVATRFSFYDSVSARVVYVTLIVVFLVCFLFNENALTPRILQRLRGPSRKDSGQEHDDNFASLSIVLHPEDHVNRPPDTLVYNWVVTKGFRYPDGVRKEVYLINDCFPGETIEARSGDRIIVNVTNGLRDEGLAVHWHGLRMEGNNDMDGAVGITQNPISPDETFLYNFTISDQEHGTFWYHGHDKTQRDDGLYGGLVVHRPPDHHDEQQIYIYDEEILLLIGDWYHRSSKDVLAWYMNSRSFGNEPVPDSLVLNGRGNFDCELAVPARPLECLAPVNRTDLPRLYLDSSKLYRLRVVNTGSLTGFSLSLTDASLSPFQVDGGSEIKMVEADGIGIVYPGERVDAILRPRVSAGEHNLVIQMDDENFKYPNPALNPEQIFPVSMLAASGVPEKISTTDLEYYNLQAAVPPTNVTKSWPEEPIQFVLYTTTLKLAKHHNIPMGFINRTSWVPQASPAQPLISLSRSQFDKNQLSPKIPAYTKHPVTTRPAEGWVDIVINNLDDGGHPFHMHGYSFYVMSVFPAPIPSSRARPPLTHGGSGMYNYNPFNTKPGDAPGEEYNLVNPVKRDTVFVPQRGYAVLRFRADNPGIWMMHCHVGWHMGSGMAMSWDIR